MVTINCFDVSMFRENITRCRYPIHCSQPVFRRLHSQNDKGGLHEVKSDRTGIVNEVDCNETDSVIDGV